MKYYNNYELTYRDLKERNELPILPSDSLMGFFKHIVSKRISPNQEEEFRILEVGAGICSIFEGFDSSDYQITALDISPTAVELARRQNKNNHITFCLGDVCQMSYCQEFELVVDGHCLHCLTDNGDRQSYYHNIYQSLKLGGIFALETMVSHRRMDFDEGYHFLADEETLFKRANKDIGYYDLRTINGDKYLPFRKIIHALNVEKEILAAGLKIIFLRVYENHKMIPDNNRTYSCLTDPDLFQAIAIKLPKL